MLLNNEKHELYHKTSPQDCKWGTRNEKGELNAVATIQVQRQTIDNEQLSFSVPVFADDTRESLDVRIGMMMSLAQERIEDANKAWAEAADKADEEERAKAKERNRKGK